MPSSIRKVLDELPTTLDETYERALKEIPKEQRQHAHRLFQCLVVAIRPLRVEELAEIFAIDFDDDAGPNLKEGWRPEDSEDAVLSACSTLIAVIDDDIDDSDDDSDDDGDDYGDDDSIDKNKAGDGDNHNYKSSKIVQFSHFSVKEYLTSNRLRTSEIGYYHIPLDTAHTILARACLTVLLQLDENTDKKRLETFPLALYAAQHWVDHAKYEDVVSRIQDAIEQLFNPSKPYLPAWTWIHDVDSGRVRRTIRNLKERPKRPEATALYYAVLCGFSGLANYLISTHGENVNAKCGNHGTPLHAASYKGHLDAARVLLAHRVDVNATNEEKKTPLCSAYDGRHLDAMRLLLEHGADVDVPYDDDQRLLHEASTRRGQADTVHLLLQHSADVNVRNYIDQTPLHRASRHNGLARVAQILLEHGAIINAQDCVRCTPLYDASERGHTEAVQVLLKHGADVHIRGQYNLTPFQVATRKGHVEIAQLLLDNGAEKE
jgi:ankyrin repeat protein